MKTDNELIAEFMGLHKNPHDGGKTWAKEIEYINGEIHGDNWRPLHYETSWDWLMPVVQNIGKLYEANFPKGDEFMRRILAHEDPIDKEYVDVISTSIYSRIDEVYNEVVKFIKWYNAQPK